MSHDLSPLVMLNVSRVAIAKLLGVCLNHDLIYRDMLSLLLPLAIEDSIC